MKTSILVSCLGATAALVGCTVDEPKLGSTAGVSFEEFRAQAKPVPTGGFIVEWDIFLKDEAALEKYWERNQASPRGGLAIYTDPDNGNADIKWSETQKVNLTYCISSTTLNFGGTNYYQQVKTAFEAATDLGWEMFANIDFIHLPEHDANCTPNNTSVLFDVNGVDAGGAFIARAFFPPPGTETRAESNVVIDPSAFDPNLPWPLTNVVVHELGHVLGFRHEHTRPNSGTCFEDNNWRAVTAYDSASTMHYPHCNGTSTTLGFSAMDQVGAEAVYGAPIPNLPPMTMSNMPSDGATVPPTFMIESSVVDEDLVKVDLYIDNVFFASKLAANAPFNFEAMNILEGAHELKLIGIDKRNQMGMQVINVTVEEDSGCCSAGGSPAGAGLLAGLTFLGLVGLGRRRRS